MSIPASFGRLRFEGDSCFLEHRSTNNQPIRTRLVRALPDDSQGSSADAVAYFRDDLGIGDGSQIFIDGFLVGEDADLNLAVRAASIAPTHRGILSYSGARSLLQKSVGTRLLKLFGGEALATQMLRNCGKQDGELIELTGTETISSSGIPSIEIDSVVGC